MGITAEESDGPFIEDEEAPAPRDADGVCTSEWQFGEMPRAVAGRKARYQVVFRRSVLNDIRAHGLASPDVEVCGVILGNLYRDAEGPWCYIEANIRGNYAAGRNAQVTFTSETWTHIHEEMEKRFPGMRIVGWYHTHPGFGIFLSEMDLFIQENFFAEPWQIAFVDDPKGGDRGVFVWHKAAAVRDPYLVKEDVPEESPLAGDHKGAGWFRKLFVLAGVLVPTAGTLLWLCRR